MHVGQPVALVVAESIALAQDAAELVAVEYEEVKRGRGRGARRLRRMRRSSGPKRPQCGDRLGGPVQDDGSNAREIEKIFAGAAHVARVSAVNQRLVVASMEPRGATARHDARRQLHLAFPARKARGRSATRSSP